MNSNDLPKYKGKFVDGFMHGLGQFFDEEGGLLYSGGFEFDNISCKSGGKLYDEFSGRVVYKGGFQKGNFSGYGVLYAMGSESEARILEGAFRKGMLRQGRQFGEFRVRAGGGKSAVKVG